MFRARFAPSPTGFIHIGNARSAIFNYLFAKNNQGQVFLRIEDTDMERSTKESELSLLKDLEWLGLSFDGEVWKQSERLDVYWDYAHRLVNEGKAYYCFCSEEDLEKEKAAHVSKKVWQYSGKCRHLSQEAKSRLLEKQTPFTIRFHNPSKPVVVKDILRGEISFPEDMVGDFVIIRSNKMPVYNFSVVVDDALMNITHVIRGEEHLPNTVRQILLYEAFQFPIPHFAHTALIIGEDGSKLSKRHGATTVGQFREMGYLPEAIFNYLATLGWSPPEGKEKCSRQELIELFNLEKVHKSPAKFDLARLNWLNALFIKEQSFEALYPRLLPYMSIYDGKHSFSSQEMTEILKLCYSGIEFLQQIVEKTQFFFAFPSEIGSKDSPLLQGKSGELIQAWAKALQENTSEELFSYPDQIKQWTLSIGETFQLSGKNLFMPLRYALTGMEKGPDLFEIMKFLGRKNCQERIQSWNLF